MFRKLSICHKQIFPETKRLEYYLIKFNEHLYNFNNYIRVNTLLYLNIEVIDPLNSKLDTLLQLVF